ncbi:glucosamine-6-phosphate deaminase [Halanaerobacter jeridensis]|uniref:Glucosamine-6-phosphate deaminase n=1 Tax=Halanaerobacter jeridensis TaxID=706427 RepID=A0A939BMA7_9FIRM|nr:glucosamine-6-phosphate deaminase [Halanaerobacter jeridensis]MBM7555950.1 glucosamine-6-phosphate deaminase [Halanaerobacter jeridensis]
MEIEVLDNYKKLSLKAATMVSSQITSNPNSVLGLATGETPLGMYEELISMYEDDLVDFGDIITFNLDEYLDLDPHHEQSYHYYMYNNFFNQVNIKEKNIHIPQGKKENCKKICSKYDKEISRAGGIDLQILGIGTNGHIGFNEPDHKLHVDTHVVELAEDTIEANSRFFSSKDEVPRQAISMGMSSIMKANKILLLASGEKKAEAIKKSINGEITTRHPASLLQLHTNVTILADQAAAKFIR